jgi:hypothetical protein
MEGSSKRNKNKVKIFNKVYKEMQRDIKVALKKTTHMSFIINDVSEIEIFSTQMKENNKLYVERDVDILKKVDLLNQFFFNKPALTSANKEAVWKYLQVMYSMASEEKKELVKQKQPLDINKLGDMVSTLMNDKDSGFGTLIEDISEKLKGKLGGNDEDKSKILQDLMAGKMESSGINFKDIISQATNSIKEKVDAGEIDMDKMKSVAENIKTTLNM